MPTLIDKSDLFNSELGGLNAGLFEVKHCCPRSLDGYIELLTTVLLHCKFKHGVFHFLLD